MGSGKTTVGRMLAARLSRTFIDTDHEVERVHGRSVEAIFRESGEGRFRDAEYRALRSAAGIEGAVVATGGGLFLAAAARATIRAAGASLWLDVPLSTVRARIEAAPGRPLWRGHDDPLALRAMFERRRATYALADARIDAAHGGADQVVARILASPLIFRA
jgi:shikimate kinase